MNLEDEKFISQSTDWINGKDNLFGYLPFSAANYLVKTKKYKFHSASIWGYIIEKIF
jgi:hypothetical protein